jgi:hypothetical protein
MILSTSLLTSFDPTWLFLSIIPSAVGFVLFRYGKKQQRWPQMAAGLLFMVYPYFTAGTLSLIATGVVIGLGLWIAIRLDW